MLYFRQILIMLVSLYTVRVVLKILGAEDYGIYSVVGGLVVLFTFLNSAMTSATQRFLNFALGRNDEEQARDVYSASLVIHALIAVAVIVLAQTAGLWFFHTWLNIPAERQTAAFAVYQFSIAATAIGILQVPYRATIIAYEKMSFFALLSIAEAGLRLGIVFLLPIVRFDQLAAYSFFVCITVLAIFLAHKFYCNKAFETARFRYCRNRELFKHLIGFSGWSTFGGLANLSREQGTNVLLNIFHGVTVNAAVGIAAQVNSAVYQFVSSFQTAFNPQIIKSYSAKEYDYFMTLIFRTSKASFCLLFFFVLPLYINMELVLQMWLNDVPEYAISFTRLLLLSSLITAIAGPLMSSVQATGNIKKYQLIVSCFIFSNLPLSFLLLLADFSPVWTLIARIAMDALILIWRTFFLRGLINLSVLAFLYKVIIPIIMIAVISSISSFFMYSLFAGQWSRLISSCLMSTFSIGCIMYLIGLTKQEKVLLRDWIKERRSI